MVTDNLSTLKIYKLTKEQYERKLEAGEIDENAFYFTDEKSSDVSIDDTLSVSGAAADAKAVGDAIAAMNYIYATDDGNGIVTLGASPLTPAEEAEF